MNTRGSRVALLLILAAFSMTAAAAADQTQTVTATTTDYTFSNPNYGPWTVESLEFRVKLPQDVPAITLVDRRDTDAASAAQSQGVYLDDYHTFSRNFYVYAQAGSAGGTVLPSKDVYLEGDLKVGPRGSLVLAAGGAILQNADGSMTRYVSAGPAFYTGRMVFTLRFMPSNTSGIGTSAAQFGIQYNQPGRNAVALSWLGGTQPNVLVGLPASAADFQRVSQTVLTFKHWINPHEGFVVGETFGNFTDVSGKNNSYRQQGLTFGVFIEPR